MDNASAASRSTAAAVSLWLWTFSSGSLALGTLLNVSASDRVIFHRYSLPWFTFICLSFACFGALAVTTVWRTLSRSRQRPAASPKHSPYGFLLALAAASWGTSLLSQYRIDPYHLRRLAAGEFFGATQTAGVLLEYLSQGFIALAIMLLLTTQALRASAHRRRALSRVLLLAAALLGTYLIAEGSVRILNVAWPRTQGAPTKPSRIWMQRYAALNTHGYRDREFERRTDGTELRVLVIGDSYTFGIGIRNPGDRFSDVLEASLGATGAFHSVRVFNAGKPDTDSEDHLRMLDTLMWLDPDVVLLAYVFNDIEYLSPPPVDPTFDPPTFRARFGVHRLLMLNSHLFDQLLLRYRAYRSRRSGTVDHDLAAYADPELLRRHFDLLMQIFERTRAAGAGFRLVPFDIAVRAGPAYEERYRRFVRAAAERGIPVWSLGDLFDGFAYETLVVNGWDHHPNEVAHRLVGSFLRTRIVNDQTLGIPCNEACLRTPSRSGRP